MKFYAGIGSRKTPPEMLSMMSLLAKKLESQDWILRSGGAGGADDAFAKAVSIAEIYLPWKGFNDWDGDLIGASSKAMEIAERIHPAWDRCSQGAKKLHGRNVHQILGKDIDPKTYSSFVICWTPNGEDVGGTATAIKLAREVGIKIYNLAIKEDYDKMQKFLKED